MKKIIIATIAILLAALIYVLLFEKIEFNNWKTHNIGDIKQSNEELDKKIKEAKQINSKNYPESLKTLESSIKKLKTTKKEYIAKTESISENVELGIVEIKQYKIERLWITLENYAKELGLELVLNLVESNNVSSEQKASNVYDLEIMLLGEYRDISHFIYKIENDDMLDFRIKNFKLVKYLDIENDADKTNIDNENSKQENTQENKNQENVQENKEDHRLKAEFTIENVGIEFK